jgi:hypothetical protein
VAVDEPPLAEGSNELAFIEDEEWRDALRSDLAAVESALRNGEWKATTVLGGSLVEALLLWAVNCHDVDAKRAAIARVPASVKLGRPHDPASPEGWDLIHYIEVAFALDEISEDTASQARLAKNFRNLIHPGRERVSGMRSDRGTAYSAAAAVQHDIRDLSRKHRRERN